MNATVTEALLIFVALSCAILLGWLMHALSDFSERERLRGIVESLAARVAAQSELLSARAEKSSSSADDVEIITLCGSTKFKQQYIEANFRLTMMGKIVLSVGLYSHADAATYTPTTEEKARLDWLHLRKIDHSHSIYVINVGGYVGSSTSGEIAHARATGKRIYWHETPPGEPDLKPLPPWSATGKPPVYPEGDFTIHLPVVSEGDEPA